MAHSKLNVFIILALRTASVNWCSSTSYPTIFARDSWGVARLLAINRRPVEKIQAICRGVSPGELGSFGDYWVRTRRCGIFKCILQEVGPSGDWYDEVVWEVLIAIKVKVEFSYVHSHFLVYLVWNPNIHDILLLWNLCVFYGSHKWEWRVRTSSFSRLLFLWSTQIFVESAIIIVQNCFSSKSSKPDVENSIAPGKV